MPFVITSSVAVGIGLGDRACGDGATRAAPVLDHHRLAQLARQSLGEHARGGVGHAARAERHDQPDRLRRIRLRPRRRHRQRRSQQDRQTAARSQLHCTISICLRMFSKVCSCSGASGASGAQPPAGDAAQAQAGGHRARQAVFHQEVQEAGLAREPVVHPGLVAGHGAAVQVHRARRRHWPRPHQPAAPAAKPPRAMRFRPM